VDKFREADFFLCLNSFANYEYNYTTETTAFTLSQKCVHSASRLPQNHLTRLWIKSFSDGQMILLTAELRKIPVTTSDEAVANSLKSGSLLFRQGNTSVYIYS